MAKPFNGRNIDQWTCQVCGKVYVVPSMARHCEWKHTLSKK